MNRNTTKSAHSLGRRFGGALRALVIGATLALAGAAWADTAVVNGLIWTYGVSSGKATITDVAKDTAGAKPSGALTIPSKVNSYTVTAIGVNGLDNMPNVTSITIPDTVTTIGGGAFLMNTGITSVTIPNSVTSIGDYAFQSCSKLASVTIGSGVKSIPANAFEGCRALTSIYLPSAVTSLGSQAFKNCSSLKTVRMPKALMGKFTETAVFSGNASGLEIRYYGSETSGGYTFSYELVSAGAGGTRSAELIKVSSSGYESLAISPNPGSSATVTVPRYLGGGYSVTSIGTYAFQSAGMGSVVLPADLKTIKYLAFYNCEYLKSVTIPDSVTTLANGAFYSCPRLTTVSMPKAFIGKLTETSVFPSCQNLAVTYRFDSSVNAQKVGNYFWYYRLVNGKAQLYRNGATAVWNENGSTSTRPTGSVTVPSTLGGATVSSIGNYAFTSCADLTTVILPSDGSVTNIGNSAFSSCSKLTTVSNISNLKSIGSAAFQNCSSLTITLPSGLTSIGASAFSSCSKLTSISIPSTVTSIGNYAFTTCGGLTSVTLASGLKSIPLGAFQDCTSLTKLYIPSAVTSIGNYAFKGCTKLYDVHMPKALLSSGLGTDVFANCASNLECRYYGRETPSDSSYSWDYEIVDRKGVKSAEVVYRAPNLGYAYALNNLPSSGGRVVVEMPTTLGTYTVRSIGQYAFNGRSTLGQLVIASTVTNIASYAFNESGITTVTVPDNVKGIGDYAFKDCTNLKAASLPSALYGKIDESRVFSGCSSDLVVTYRVDSTISKQKVGNYLWYFKKLSNNTAEITWKINYPAIDPQPTGAVTIPSTLGGMPVTSLGISAFDGCTGLTGVGTIPSTVTNFGKYAFYNCKALTSITLPSSLKAIENSVFYHCDKLTSVTIPSSVMSMGASAFAGCTALKTLKLGSGNSSNSLKTIGENAFLGCSALTYAYVPSTVTSIGNNAFKDCTSLTRLHLQASTFLGKVTQNTICPGCSSSDFRIRYYGTVEGGGLKFWYERITKNDAILNTELARWYNTEFGSAVQTSAGASPSGKVAIPSSIAGMSFASIGKYAFYNLASVTEVEIPSTVKTIEAYAFDKSGITTVTVPDSVTTIGNYAFRNCASLVTASLPGAFLGKLNESVVFQNSPNVQITYRISGSVKAEKVGNYYWCYKAVGSNGAEIYRNGSTDGSNPAISPKPTGTATISIPQTIGSKTVNSIGQGAFAGCTGIAGVEIPNTVTNIGKYAFYGSALTSVTIPGSVERIGFAAFKNCTNLEELSLANGLKYIEQDAFSGCSKLTEVVIPNTVKEIGREAFNGCSQLATVTIGSGVTSIGYHAFYGTALKTVYVAGGNVEAVKKMFTDSSHSITGITFIDMNAWIVTFNPNGGTGGTTRSVSKGSTLGTLPTSSRTGYTFNGWYTDPVNGTKISTSTKPTSDVTYYAHWTVNQYTLTFNANGGTGGTTMKLDYNSTLVPPTVTRTGYTFAGWSPAVPAKVPAANTTYTAQWELIPVVYHTVTFNANGGTGGTTRQVESGKAVGTLPSTSRSGYTFNGWFTSASGGTQISASTTVSADVTYYAHWTVIPPTMYVVAFNVNGGVISGSASRSVESGKPVGQLPGATRVGYTLLGWFTAASGGTQVDAGSMVTGNVTYFAQWKANEYVVTFNANGGACDTPTKKVTYDATYGTLPAATRNNYTFNGWFTAATGGTKVESTTAVKITAAQTLYAQWTAIPQVVMRTVTFNPQGGTAVASRTVEDGKAVGTLPTTSRDGYSFKGWFTAASGGTKISATTLVTANVTFHAQWTKTATTTYTVMFDAKGGAANKTEITVNAGAQIGSQLPNASRTGYKFTGWFTGESQPVDASTVVNANMSCWASWQPNTFTLTLNANGGTVSPATVTVVYDGTYGTLPVATRDGYAFLGWFTAQNGGTKIAETVVFKQTANQTLYAHWEENVVVVEHTVTFNPGSADATVSPTSVKVKHGDAIGMLPVPEREGYTCIRWAVAGTEIKPTTVVLEDFVCTAEWQATAYTVTFNAAGGAVTPTVKDVTYNSAYGTLPSPTRTGYSFKGWFTKPLGGGVQVTAGTVLTRAEDHTLYAKWEEIPHGTYNVTFDAAGGTCTETSRTVVEGDPIGTLPTVTRLGYDFLGWADPLGNFVSDGTVVAADMACTAQWQAKKLTVTFNAQGGTVSPKSKSVTYDSPYGTLPAATRSNYSFVGWFTAATGGTKIESTTVVKITVAQTLYAQWISSKATSWKDTSTGITWYYRKTVDGEGVELYNAGSCVVSPAPSGLLEIPKTIAGYPVMAIGEQAFNNCKNLTGVTIPFSVTAIGDRAFANSGLDDYLQMPGLVKTIGEKAFSGCTKLDYVSIGSGVEEMGDFAFQGCTSLQSVTYAQGSQLKKFPAHMFDGCTSLAFAAVSEADEVTIGGYAYKGCKSLTRAFIEENVKGIEYGAFEGTALKTVYISPMDEKRVRQMLADSGLDLTGITFEVLQSPFKLPAGKYIKVTLEELGFDAYKPAVPGTPYTVAALGLPSGLKLKYNAAVKDKNGRVTKKAKVDWWIEGVPTGALDYATQPTFLTFTADGTKLTVELGLSVVAQKPTELNDPSLWGEVSIGQSFTADEPTYLPDVGKGWTVSGLPTGLKFATNKVTKKSGKKTVTVAEAYTVYGKTTKAGLFNITAKKKKGAYYETLKFKVLVMPKYVDSDYFGSLADKQSVAYETYVEWYLEDDVAADGVKVTKVTGLPTGLKFAASNVYAYENPKKKTGRYVAQEAQTIVGTPTKAGTFVVTFTKKVKVGKTTKTKTAQILWTVTASSVKPNPDFSNPDEGCLEEVSLGVKYADLLTFSAAKGSTVTASGLPKGMSLKKTEDGKWSIVGNTTKSGVFLITVKASLNGNTVTQRRAIRVNALPSWAKGTFPGYFVDAYSSVAGMGSLTVSSVGKISGKFVDNGKTWTYSAASFAKFDGTVFSVPVTAKCSYKVKGVKKTETRKFTLTVYEGSYGGEVTLDEDGKTAHYDGFQNLWTSKYKQVGRALFYTSSKKQYKTFTQSWDVGGQTCPLSLKITSTGTVTATLTYDTGKKSKGKVVYYKPTCSTVVKPTSDADPNTFTGQVQLYFAPSAGNNFPGWTEVITVSP